MSVEYTRIIKICDRYFEEVDPSYTLTRKFTLEEAKKLACTGCLELPKGSLERSRKLWKKISKK